MNPFYVIDDNNLYEYADYNSSQEQLHQPKEIHQL